jgi:glutamate-1-semialdehyde 2,1-aminomutase
VRFGELLSPVLGKFDGRVHFVQLESIFALYFTSVRSVRNVEQVKKSDMKAFAKFHGEMLKRGVYLAPSGYEVGFLSTAHTIADLEETADAVSESLDVVLG